MNAAPMTQPRFSATPATMSMASASTNVSRNLSRSASNTSTTSAGGILTGWVGALLVVGVLVILFAVYYKTIGYYINIGWKKLKGSHDRGEVVEVDAPGGVSAQLTPAAPSQSKGIISTLESDVEAALGYDSDSGSGSASGSGSSSGKKQVFNISRNLYTFGDAEPVCRAFGAELATYDQVKEAYTAGADWCNYGWTKGQLAIYPTQNSTYEKLQQGPEHERMTCGLPGVNGGYFPNADERFGVNCYGPRPTESALDERVQLEERSNTAFDRKVNHYKSELDGIAVNPWSAKQWSS